MSRKVTRRRFMAGTAAAAAVATFKFPMPAIAQAAPFKLGLLTVKTGPLAQGGIQMEQGIVTFLKEKNYTFAGFLQSCEQFGLGLDFDRRLPSILAEVTLDDIRSAAAEVLRPEIAAVSIAGPGPAAEGQP